MTTFFADTSALAKRYLIEVGSTWVINWIEPAAKNVTIMSELALAEMRSLLARQVRENILSPTNATALRNDFLLHAQQQYLIVPLDSALLAAAAAEGFAVDNPLNHP